MPFKCSPSRSASADRSNIDLQLAWFVHQFAQHADIAGEFECEEGDLNPAAPPQTHVKSRCE
jgi:hypothetical protein